MRLVIVVLAATLTVSGCGGSDPAPVAATPAASTKAVVTDKWALETCEYLAGQDPYNEYHHSIAATFAGMSSLADLVELAQTAKAANNANVLRGWCVENVPQAGVEIATPR